MDRIWNGLASFAMRHEKALAIAGAAWLALSSAVYARFVALPEIPFLTDEWAIWTSAGWNAAWWGFIHPQIDARRKRLAAEADGEKRR